MVEFSDMVSMLKEKFPSIEMSEFQTEFGPPSLQLPCETIDTVCAFLKDDERLHFDSLMNMTGVDYPPDFIAVIYHLHSMTHRHKLTLRIMTPRENGQVPSVVSLWGLANWFEREIFDLLGIKFAGHPDLRRLLLPQDWVGHPLRKDYQEQPEYNGMPTTRTKTIGQAR